MNRTHLARVAHEINRAYCASMGDLSVAAWAEAGEAQQASILAGVDMHLANPNTTPEQAHEAWLAQKTADGWTFGGFKDAEQKIHPCMMPYADLPDEQRAKDFLFRAVVHQLKDEADPVAAAPAETVTTETTAAPAPVAPSAAAIQLSATPDGFLPVQYIGKRETYKDGLYGTGLVFTKGQTRLVPAEPGRKMLTHPDQYVLGKSANAGSGAAVIKTAENQEDPLQEMRDSIASMTKDALATFAKSHYQVDLDKGKRVGDLRIEVTGLVDQFGVV